jgi:chromosome segregation protein
VVCCHNYFVFTKNNDKKRGKAKIIRKFSDNSQFIIVTHNKRTMSATDIMYGVTMIEQGVSRVVAVDLREI